MKKITKSFILILTVIFFQSCSYRTSEFFEDIIADNKTIKADGQFKSKVAKDFDSPILTDKDNGKDIDPDEPVVSRGKIVSVNFDKDYNLYVYTFIDEITKKPITFFYDKNIRYRKNDRFKIVVKGNYLSKITPLSKDLKPADDDASSVTPQNRSYKRRYKKRRRSFIKTPIEERINTL